MELEGIGLIATSRQAADYDSTLAALDELEKELAKLKRRFLTHTGYSSDHNIEDRLTALEALEGRVKKLEATGPAVYWLDPPEVKVGKPEALPCNMISCSRYPCAIPKEKRFGCYRMQPPDICGNCNKPWRRDKDKGLVLCYEESDSPQYKANGVPACPCYERREA